MIKTSQYLGNTCQLEAGSTIALVFYCRNNALALGFSVVFMTIVDSFSGEDLSCSLGELGIQELFLLADLDVSICPADYDLAQGGG